MSAAVDYEDEFVFGDDLSVMLAAEPGSAQIKAVFGGFPAAVGALCAVVDGVPRGLVATSMSVGVSYDPPMVLFSIRNDSSTWPHLRRAGRIGISVLGETQGPVCGQLASKQGDRFAGLATLETSGGALLIEGAISWMECAIENEVPAGDHAIVILRVERVGHAERTSPLVFHRSRFPVLRHLESVEGA
jgi:flavin reductase (DIM6/NTAB) family NADH-FMN oxidoreductase RutF